MVYKLIGESEFITSDSPVMLMNRLDLDATPFTNGLMNNHTVLYYPITSKLLIAIYAEDTLLWQMKNYDGKLALVTDSDGNERFIKNVNVKQLEQCTRQVYSKSKKTLNKLKEN